MEVVDNRNRSQSVQHCPTCGQTILSQNIQKVKKARSDSVSSGTFEMCDGPLGFMIAPSFERRQSSVSTTPHVNWEDQNEDGADEPREKEDGESSRKSSKRHSLVNLIRRLSSPFVEEMDVEKLEERRQSRSEKLEASVDKYCRLAKFE